MQAKIQTIINDIFSNLERNNFAVLSEPDQPIWQEPLIGVAAGDDDYYNFLKEHIGAFHWSPKEVFALKYEDEVRPEDLRVISMVFPQIKKTKAAQQKANLFPCDYWLVSRGEWEPLMQEFSGKLVNRLEKEGIRCVSIDLQPQFHLQRSGKLGIASVWSHRHSAYAAGLGTFGLSDGLITEKGKAVRITSLIVEAPLEVTKRPYQGHYDWCLFYQNGSCKACVSRCPVNAISKQGHDKEICNAYEAEAISKYWPDHIERGDYIFGCGLCQVGIPCQDKRP